MLAKEWNALLQTNLVGRVLKRPQNQNHYSFTHFSFHLYLLFLRKENQLQGSQYSITHSASVDPDYSAASPSLRSYGRETQLASNMFLFQWTETDFRWSHSNLSVSCITSCCLKNCPLRSSQLSCSDCAYKASRKLGEVNRGQALLQAVKQLCVWLKTTLKLEHKHPGRLSSCT